MRWSQPTEYAQQEYYEEPTRGILVINVITTEDAEVLVNGNTTQQKGVNRKFTSYGYYGRTYRFTIESLGQTATVRVAPGQQATVNFLSTERKITK